MDITKSHFATNGRAKQEGPGKVFALLLSDKKLLPLSVAVISCYNAPCRMCVRKIYPQFKKTVVIAMNQEHSDTPKDRHIGLHGPRSTGKTCFWTTCLHGVGPTPHDEIILLAGDEKPLADAWDALKNHDVPGATAATQPDEFDFILQSSKYCWTIRTKDYAGELVQKGEKTELKNEVREWLRGSDGCMIFLDAATLELPSEKGGAVSKDASDRHAEISCFLAALMGGDNAIKKPIALVVTKWDQYYNIPAHEVEGNPFKSPESPIEEQKKLKEYLENNDALKGLLGLVKQSGETVEVFPVSAFGFNGKNYETEPAPFNLHAPIEWLARKVDDILFSTADEKAQEIQKRSSVLDWIIPGRNPTQVLALYNDIVAKKGIDAGPVFVKIEERRQSFKRKKSHQWYIGWTCYAVILFAIVFGSGSYHAANLSEHCLSRLYKTRTVSEVLAIQEEFRSSWNPLSALLFGTQMEENVAARTKYLNSALREYQVKEFELLTEFRVKHDSEEDSESRVEECQKYVKDPETADAPERQDVNAWLREDKLVCEAYRKNKLFDTEYDTLLDAIRKLDSSPESLPVAGQSEKEFLVQHPKSEFSNKATIYENIADELRLLRNRVFDSAYYELCEFIRQSDTSVENAQKKIGEFRNKYPQSAFSQKITSYENIAKELRSLQNKVFDSAYDELCETIRQSDTSVEDAQKKIGEFRSKFKKTDYPDKSAEIGELDNELTNSTVLKWVAESHLTVYNAF